MADKRLLFSPAAEADLEAIWLYTAEHWSAEQADRYVLQIHGCGLELAAGRRKGRSLASIRPGYFKANVGSHLVVYRIVGDAVDVVRILHRRMDIEARLDE